MELKIHRRGKLDRSPTWAHIGARDHVPVRIRRPKTGLLRNDPANSFVGSGREGNGGSIYVRLEPAHGWE